MLGKQVLHFQQHYLASTLVGGIGMFNTGNWSHKTPQV